jgi:hypothetical protein
MGFSPRLESTNKIRVLINRLRSDYPAQTVKVGKETARNSSIQAVDIIRLIHSKPNKKTRFNSF